MPHTQPAPTVPAPPEGAKARLTVALLGNPNTGKTTLFNGLTGLRQRVGNYPGVTVEKKVGQLRHGDQVLDVIDLPGTYSLAPRSPDEMVAVDVLLGRLPGEPRPDVLVSIVDASNLERNLYLTTQLLDLERPVVVALNMTDVAERQGRPVDAARLQRQLGLPVVPIQAHKRQGLDRLAAAILAAAPDGPPLRKAPFPPAFEDAVQGLQRQVQEAANGCPVPAFLIRRLLLDVGGSTEQLLTERHGPKVGEAVTAARKQLADAGCPVPAVEARSRYAWIRGAIQGCVARPAAPPVTWTDRLDRVLTHKVFGTLIFLALMFLLFQAIFTWARPLMDLINGAKEAVGQGLAGALPSGPLTSLLVDGVLEGVGGVLVFLPQIMILFGFVAVLEDCGYMARAAFLMDKLMARCGLSGKSFIPLLSSVACAVPGIMATRVIENRRDRLATILVAPLMSCSARLPVYVLLIGAFLTAGYAWWVPGLALFGLYALGLVVAPLVALVLKRTLLRGETPVFVMEMPVYKWPAWRTVGQRMLDSGGAFVRRAGTLILASMILVWALLYFPSTDAQGQRYEHLIEELEKPVAEQKRQLKDLEEQTAEPRKELAHLDYQARKGDIGASLLNLYGLIGPGATEREAARDARREELRKELAPTEERLKPLREVVEPVDEKVHALEAEWKKNSILGRVGRFIEPAVRPLGWDWKVGMAALASFPAREVVVGTLGIIYNLGKADAGEIREADDPGETDLGKALRAARWDGEPERPVFTVPAVLSLLVFFALCCQCASTLAVIRRETNSWRWPAFTFVYMTALAYVGALVTYQVGRLFG